MKKQVGIALVIILIINLMFGLQININADDYIDEGICGPSTSYTLDNNGLLTISGTGDVTKHYWDTFKDDIKSIVIEDGVTSLCERPFQGLMNLVSVNMSDTVTNLGGLTFVGDYNLTTIRLSNNLNAIPNDCFVGCNQIKSIYIPDSVETIGEKAFYSINSLYTITGGNNISVIEKGAFDACSFISNSEMYKDGLLYLGKVLFRANSSCEDSVQVKEGTVSIGDYAFYELNITDVKLPSTVKYVNYYSFKGCKKLKSINLPDGLLTIGISSFSDCILLPISEIPSTVTKIDRDAFYNCRKITSLKVTNKELNYAMEYSLQYSISNMLETLYGYTGSTTQEYAQKYSIDFISLDEEDTTTQTSTTVEPTTENPTTQTPTTENPTTQTPTTENPTTQTPTTEETTTVELTTEMSTTQTPTTVESTTVSQISTDSITTNITTDNITTEENTTTKNIVTTDMTTTEKKIEETTKENNDSGIKKNETVSKPSLKKIQSKNYHSSILKWTKATNAKKYYIYRAAKKNKNYKLIAVIVNGKISYLDTKMKPGIKYFYKVAAVGKNGEKVFSNYKSIKLKGTPNTPKIKVYSKKNILYINWGIINDNSKAIEIFVSTGKSFTKIKSSTKIKKNKNKKGVVGAKSSLLTLTKNKTYKFKARTYAIVNGKRIYSKWSKVRSFKRK